MRIKRDVELWIEGPIAKYHEFLKKERKQALAILEIIASQSREWSLNGQKLIGLVQINDTKIELPEF